MKKNICTILILEITIPITFAWFNDKEIKIREEKIKNYNRFLYAMTVKFSNMGDKNNGNGCDNK